MTTFINNVTERNVVNGEAQDEEGPSSNEASPVASDDETSVDDIYVCVSSTQHFTTSSFKSSLHISEPCQQILERCQPILERDQPILEICPQLVEMCSLIVEPSTTMIWMFAGRTYQFFPPILSALVHKLGVLLVTLRRNFGMHLYMFPSVCND